MMAATVVIGLLPMAARAEEADTALADPNVRLWPTSDVADC